MITFENVTKRYPGGLKALQEVSFELVAGEMAFLTGHSGAGKSTLMRLILMLDNATRGQVLVNGKNLTKMSRSAAPGVRQGIGMIFQDHKLLRDKTIFDNVALPLMIAGIRYNDIRKRVRAALDKVGLLHRERAWPLALSGGEQQRVGIARAIVGMPPILLADEPTGNLDPELSRDLLNLFRQLNAQGVTVLIASHDLALIREMGQRVLVLSKGQLIDDIPAGITGSGQRPRVG
ncbi:MAG TPA: cell division ATP-binding protein FtsE [Xanthomonadales bacterium]|nr:cell division ATP-binding protein FtsE [Xanthomonadales bacterium]